MGARGVRGAFKQVVGTVKKHSATYHLVILSLIVSNKLSISVT